MQEEINQESQSSSPGENSTTVEPKSAIEALREATEHKEPGENSTGPGWTFPEPGEDPVQDPEPDEPADKKAEGKTAADKLKNPKIPDEVKRASAETAALMYDEVLQMICNPIVNHKFGRKFTAEEKEIILEQDIEFKDLDKLDEKQQILKKKWDLNVKKRDAKIKAIPLDSSESKRVYTAFYNYFKVTDKALGPEWLLAFTMISITVDRAIEVTTD